MTDRKPEISNLDESQLDALRQQIEAAIGGQGAAVSGIEPSEPTHSVHVGPDGWF
jgi:hypothetical protein